MSSLISLDTFDHFVQVEGVIAFCVQLSPPLDVGMLKDFVGQKILIDGRLWDLLDVKRFHSSTEGWMDYQVGVYARYSQDQSYPQCKRK